VNFWKVILATVVIFGAGVLTGGLLVNYVDHSHHWHRPSEPAQRPPENHDHADQHPQDVPRPPLADRLSKQFVQQLDGKLQLTPEQHEKIAKIVAEGQERNHEIWTNAAPKMRKVMSDVNQQIREQLTPEQQKQFEELMKHPPRRSQNSTNAPPAAMPTTSPATTNIAG
jgi:Spy/CpxP family protein refolding chaperone